MNRARNYICMMLLAGLCLPAMSQPLRFFSTETREAASGPQRVVMDFLERYFQDLFTQKQTTIQTKMADDMVYFRKGEPSRLYQVCDSMPFSINLLDRHYEVTWSQDSLPFVIIVFPAQYDLLLGKSQDEVQQTFREKIASAPQRQDEKPIPSALEQTDDSVYKTQSEYFELNSLNDARYYKKTKEHIQPVFEKEHLDYSIANLFQGLIDSIDYRIYIEQSVYGMKSVSYSITLNQWLNYCAAWGLKVFFAVEEQREDGVLAMVIAQSKELGFNHLLSVVVPDSFIHNSGAVLKARLTPYIPFHNVKDLYQQQSPTHQKIKWQ